MKTRFKVLFAVMAIIGVFLTVQINNAMAYDGSSYWIANGYDVRSYDSSHPQANQQHTLGGWNIGISIFDPAMAAEVASATLVGSNAGVPVTTFTFHQADVYNWLGDENHDYAAWIGASFNVQESYALTLFDANGVQIDDVITIEPINTDLPLAPLCKIKKMAIMRNGNLKMRFTAPYDLNAQQIRIRIFDDAGNAIYQEKIDPPFEIVRKDGTIIPDKVKTFIPAEYIGHTGRIEYRTNGGIRGITYFKLPELEVD